MKKFGLFLILAFVSINAFSAFLKNVPINLKQPDGTVIHCFITGDEYHRRVHDKDNYTIIQDSITGYYVYALKKGNELIPSKYVVGKSDPKKLPIEPYYDIPSQKMEQKRSEKVKLVKKNAENSTKGNFNNIIISIRFSDQQPTGLTLQNYDEKFNSLSNVSLKSYYKEVSNSQLNVTSNFYPQTQNQTILEYQDSHPRDYYIPYNEITNPIGYQSGEWEGKEKSLIKNAIESVSNQIVSSNVNYDLNNDGFIDNLIFIIQGNPSGWGDILWPMSLIFNDSQIFIGNKKINQYNKQLSSGLNVGVICHEFFHALGAPDLYHYSFDGFDPVGSWDLMAGGITQHMTTFMKWKYGKWFDSIPEITQPGTYSLQPVSQSANACYKIPSPDNPSEYFIVEYRKKEGLLESSIPANYDDGLIIYRINTNVSWGNAGGPPDELYIYRLDGTSTINGDISKASFSSNSNRTSFNSSTNPSCFLSTGLKGWIDISNITSAGTQISFTVNAAGPLYSPQNLTASSQNNEILLEWNTPLPASQPLLGYNVFLSNNSSPINTTLITNITYQTPIPGQNDSYLFKVTAKYQQGESDPAIANYINSYTPSVKDSLALVALYKQCNGPNWTKKTNWLLKPIANWERVTVRNGRVVELNFSDWPESNGLKGQLPTEISNLTEIKRLLLTNNQLTGTLPNSWVSLVKLERLWLNLNQFSGSLPDSWSSLVNIQHIWINTNQLSGLLPQSWSSLVNLQLLNLAENKFSGTLPESWSSMVNMTDLSLNANQFSGSLPTSWSSFVKLDNLSLRDNQFSGTLPDSWSSLVNLRQFQLDNNQLTGIIPNSWKSMINMQFFTFEQNQITELPFLSSMTKLNYLRARNNSLDFGDIEPNIGVPHSEFSYNNQAPVGELATMIKNQGEEFRISVAVGGTSNKYQWFKNGTSISGATQTDYVIPTVSLQDAGIYTCQITNTVATELTLTSKSTTLQVVQLDDDGDGVMNNIDTCSNTPAGQTVNANGCSTSQLDTDNDGIKDNLDTCPNTPAGQTVNANGCATSQLDTDNDGVKDNLDTCPNTPTGQTVNATGCSTSQLDTDNDGIKDNLDTCPNTPTGESVNAIGCSQSQIDDDADGVMNEKDLCPNTVSGTNVNANGCFFLPANNFSIEVIGETCVDKNNGKISIAAQATHNYVATINSVNHNFTNNNLSVSNLAPGTYSVCIKITGVSFEQCFTITIAEGKTVSGKSSVTSNKTSIDIAEGTAPYNVFINGINVLSTISPSFILDVKHGDLVEVKTALLCEGVFSKTIDLFEGITVYPNPTKGIFEITLPLSVKEVYIELFTVGSQLISKGTYQVVNGKVQLNLENKPTGVYVVKIYLDTPVSLTIIKE